MIKVRSINGDWLRLTAKHHFPTLKRRSQIESLANSLQISMRSCYAYIGEERRVPAEVEKRFIALYGEPAADGWRDVVLRSTYDKKPRLPKEVRKPGRSSEAIAAFRENWRINAQGQARNLAQLALNHRLGEWRQSDVTLGEVAMAQYNLDEDEAIARFGDGFYTLADPEDWVVRCLTCGLVGAVDDQVQEINGLVFKVTCQSESYRVGVKA